MEEIGLKNIKIIIISLMIMMGVVIIFRLQILGTSPEAANTQNPQEQYEAEQSEEKKEEQTETKENTKPDYEYIEKDDDTKVEGNKTTANTSATTSLPTLQQETSKTDIKYNFQENAKKPDTLINSDKDKKLKEDKPKVTENKVKEYQAPQIEKTPKEIFNYAVSEMHKGNLNSAIYEFNNVIDASRDFNMTLKARRYLAQCYERKGVYSEAFDIYESIYLDTSSKNDLTELKRIAKKANRLNTVYAYEQSYLEQHPAQQPQAQIQQQAQEEENSIQYVY